MGGKPRGQRFKDIAADLQAMASGALSPETVNGGGTECFVPPLLKNQRHKRNANPASICPNSAPSGCRDKKGLGAICPKSLLRKSARGGTRTPKGFLPLDPKSSASANSATLALTSRPNRFYRVSPALTNGGPCPEIASTR